MTSTSRALRLLILVTPLFLSGCIFLTADQLQSVRLLLETGDPLPSGQFTEVYSSIYPMQLKLKNSWVQVQGQLGIDDPSDLPNKIQLQVVSVDSSTESIYDRFKLNLSVKNDGTFSGSKKFKKNLRAETLQLFMVKPNGGRIPAGTDVALCLDVAKKKGELPTKGSCTLAGGSGGGTGGGDVVTVEIVENAFAPQSVQIEPGDTVRWVLTGSDFSHTVTAMNNSFDSGFAFQAAGATFQHRFTAADDGRTFQYFCSTHQACCAMQGSVQVGANAPTPPPGY